LDLFEQPWYVGLAPLMGWLLDSVLRTGSFDGTLDRAVRRLVARLEFAMRTGLSDQPKQAGIVLSLWMAGCGAVAAWALVSTGIVLGGPVGRFVASTLVFLLILDSRGRASEGLRCEALLLEGRHEEAARHLRGLGVQPLFQTEGGLAGAGVMAVSDGLLFGVLVPLFWGLLLGPMGGAAAFGIVAVGLRARVSEEEDAALWAWPERIVDLLAVVPAWIGNLTLQLVAPIGGARRGDVFNAFIHRSGLRPHERLRGGFVGGFRLDEEAGGLRNHEPPHPGHIRRAVILMWTSSFLLLAIGTAARSAVLGAL
jgi:cobalamin biosynthesis protein CobD/CbiB